MHIYKYLFIYVHIYMYIFIFIYIYIYIYLYLHLFFYSYLFNVCGAPQVQHEQVFEPSAGPTGPVAERPLRVLFFCLQVGRLQREGERQARAVD